MKAILSTILATLVLALVGTANAAEPTVPSTALKVKKSQALTIEDLGPMLEAMGYEFKPYNNKDGKLIGYSVKNDGVSMDIEVSTDGSKLLFFGGYSATADYPLTEDAMLGILTEANRIFPTLVFYNRDQKSLKFYSELVNEDVTPVVLRQKLAHFKTSMSTIADAWLKGLEITKAKKAEQHEARMD